VNQRKDRANPEGGVLFVKKPEMEGVFVNMNAQNICVSHIIISINVLTMNDIRTFFDWFGIDQNNKEHANFRY
jgi:hypothetical protein